MPKSIVISKNKPDMIKMQGVEFFIDEEILDGVRSKIGALDGNILPGILDPQSDFSIYPGDMNKLHEEISDLLTSTKEWNYLECIFLCSLEGFCVTCIRTESALYGFAD